jgi:hypothetical protein
VVKTSPGSRESPLKRIFASDLLKTTVFASILATGIQGG